MKFHAIYSAVFILIIVQQIDNTVAFKCIKCDSSADPNCITDLTKVTAEEECATKCYTKKDTESGAIIRGCLGTEENCDTNNGCYACDSDSCNKHLICKACDSSNDVDCAIAVNNKTSNNQVCDVGITDCFINIKSDKQTERGCATTEFKGTCTNTATCKLCNTPNCNIEIFPANRTCYQCSGSVCNEVSDELAKACALYDAEMKCYTIGTSATDMQRGCTTDNQSKCTAAGGDNCLLCTGDKCNNRKYERPQTVKCEKCNSTSNANCINAQNTDVAKLTDCETPLKYMQEDMCRTQSKEGVTYRGCFYDLANLGECTASTSCKTCNTDGCNKEADNFTCIRCRSDRDKKCWKEAKDMPGKPCDDGEGSADGCFTGIWNNVVIRGCVIDLEPQPKFTCMDDTNKQCTRCLTKNCNIGEAGAAALKLTSTILLIGLTAICKLL